MGAVYPGGSGRDQMVDDVNVSVGKFDRTSNHLYVTDYLVDLNGVPDAHNFYASLVQNQKIATISSYKLDCGATLESFPVAYSTWGKLNEHRDNVLVLAHALTGSSDATDWWRPLVGPGKALDYTRFFVFCANVLGSPYGSASPLSINPKTGLPYGPIFPQTSVRDDVR
jgi:homoserine O-acetyltransferase/O-succinyltransferase